MTEPMTSAERNAVEPYVYQAANDQCTHSTYAPCDRCLRNADSAYGLTRCTGSVAVTYDGITVQHPAHRS